jgi:heat shock protein HslJ
MRTTIRLLAALASIVGVAGIAGCDEWSLGPGDGPPPIPATTELLDGRVYAASNGYVLGQHLAESTEVNLAFNGSVITASAGCRVAEGQFQIRNGRLRAPNLSFDGTPCSSQVTKQERWLLDLLRGPVLADLGSTEARVLSLGNRMISMEMVALQMDEPDQGRLESEWWRLRRVLIRSGGSAQSITKAPGLAAYDKTMPGANSIPSLSMFDGDQFEFFTGCGLVLGTFSFDEASIEFTKSERIAKSCNDRRKRFDRTVAPLFDGRFGYRFDGPDLILTRGDTTLRFFSG